MYEYTRDIIYTHCGCKKRVSTTRSAFPIAGEKESVEIPINEKCRSCQKHELFSALVNDLRA